MCAFAFSIIDLSKNRTTVVYRNLLTAISLFDTYTYTKEMKHGKQSLLLPNMLYRVTGYSDILFLESFYSVTEFIRPSQTFINVYDLISFKVIFIQGIKIHALSFIKYDFC